MVSRARSSYLTRPARGPDLSAQGDGHGAQEGVAAAYQKVKAKMSEPVPLGYSSRAPWWPWPRTPGLVPRGGPRGRRGQGSPATPRWCAFPSTSPRAFPTASSSSGGFLHAGRHRPARRAHGRPASGREGGGDRSGLLVPAHRAAPARPGRALRAFGTWSRLAARARAAARIGLAVASTTRCRRRWPGRRHGGGRCPRHRGQSPMRAHGVAAAGMARERGRVVAVGLVPFGLPREIAYMKALGCGSRAPTGRAAMTWPSRRKGTTTRPPTCAGRRRAPGRPSWSCCAKARGRLTHHHAPLRPRSGARRL